MSAAPPRIAERLLSLLLDPASRDAIAGDLAEEYAHIRRARGAIAAHLWYWSHGARSLVSCRITGRRRPDRPVIDFDMGGHMTLRDLVRPAFRQFRDQPLYAFAAAGTLALAIAAAGASFAIAKHAFLDPLPYANDEELVSILSLSEGRRSAVSPHVLEDLRRAHSPFSGFAAIRPVSVAYQSGQGAESRGGNQVTADYFTLLGVTPAVGRIWEEHERDALVVSWHFWQSALAADPGVIGRQVLIDGAARTIVGVMPQWFVPAYWSQNAFWMPLDMNAQLALLRGARTLSILARRDPHATPAQVDAFLASFSTRLQQNFPREHGRMSWIAAPLRDEMIGTARPALIGTAAAAGLLLLIVFANIAGLATAQAAASSRESAIRAALGATGMRLFIGQLADSAALAAVGTAAGIWLAQVLVTLAATYQRQFLERLPPLSLDLTTILATAAVGLTVGVVAAVLPRRVISMARPMESLQPRGASGDVKVTALRTTLVVLQVALALVLVVGAGLLIRTVAHLSRVDLGFNGDGLTVFSVTLPPGPRYQTAASQVQFERAAMERLKAIHGVASVSASVGFPIYGGMMAGLVIQGRPESDGISEIAYWSVSPNFMSALGARVIAGRGLEESDDLNAPRVVIINETMARLYWPDGNPLGAQLQIGPGSPNQPWITVVGVIADVSDLGPTERIRPTAYGSTLQYSWPRRHFSLRTTGAASISLATDIRAAMAAIDPAVPVNALSSVDQMLDDRVARYRLVMLALGVFGSVALVLCAAGLYAVVALTSRLRRREYAIRMALGAKRGGVRWMVVRQALVVGSAGTLLGVIAAAGATRWIQGMLHGVRPIDPATFAAAAGALLTLALVAAWQPARQAERVDPVETLKAE